MKTALMIFAIVLLITLPLMMHKSVSGQESFGGADAQAQKVVEQMRPDYKPWFQPLWNPPSSEIATMLFSLQAAAGAGIICYYLGYLKGRKSRRDGE